MSEDEKFYLIDGLTVDCRNFRVQRDGQDLALTPLAFDVLLFLLRNSERVVEKQELFDHVWKESFVSDNALTKIVKEIRHALADDANAPRYIVTVPKRGYRFIGEISGGVRDPNIDGREPTAKHQRTWAMGRHFRLPLSLFAVLVTFGLCIAAALFLFRTPHSTAAPSAENVPVRLTDNPADDYLPVWSPDGRKIAFTSTRDGNAEIYSMNADGSDAKNLTQNSAFDEFPEWSPDGTKIAFRSKRQGGINKIYIMDADGANVRRVTNIQGKRVTWSPDGKQLVFTSTSVGEENYEIFTINIDGTNLTRLTFNPEMDSDPAWSPDGARIAFSSARDGIAQIYLMNPDGSDPVKLTNGGRSSYHPTWSHDGEQIAFWTYSEKGGEDKSDVWVMNADGSNLVNLTNDPSNNNDAS